MSSYRISLTADESEELLAILEPMKNTSHNLQTAHFKIMKLVFEIRQGFRSANNPRNTVSARALGLSDIPDKLNVTVDLNKGRAEIIPPEITARGPKVIARYEAFKRWEANPKGVSESDYNKAMDWRFENDLMSAEESHAYNMMIMGLNPDGTPLGSTPVKGTLNHESQEQSVSDGYCSTCDEYVCKCHEK